MLELENPKSLLIWLPDVGDDLKFCGRFAPRGFKPECVLECLCVFVFVCEWVWMCASVFHCVCVGFKRTWHVS